MSKSLQQLADQVLYGDKVGSTHVDMRIQLKEWGDSEEIVLDCGGRWSKVERRWVDDGDTAQIWRVHPGQYEAAYWFADWYRAYAAGVPGGERAGRLKDIYAWFLEGGRGGGKSDLGVRAIVAMCAGMSDRICWAVSPAQAETEELRALIDHLVPMGERIALADDWGVWLESKQCFFFWNGSVLPMLSGFKPSVLKRGRVDGYLLNEGQRFSKDAYVMSRPRVADSSGLAIVTSNPPKTESGEWVTEMRDKISDGTIRSVKIHKLDNKQNPTLDFNALKVLETEFGREDYQREIMGEHVPYGDRVFYDWTDHHNVRPMPELGDITREFTKKIFGRSFDYLCGQDYQVAPYMAAEFAKVFRDPTDPDGGLLWFFDALHIKGSEHDLIDAIEERGIYTPDNTAIIADASGEFQGGERKKGTTSYGILRGRRWRWIYMPVEGMKRNPSISERLLATNARICNAKGDRKMFSTADCVFSNIAMRKWQNKNGRPSKHSDFAHVGDARSYVAIRCFARNMSRKTANYVPRLIKPARSGRGKDLDKL